MPELLDKLRNKMYNALAINSDLELNTLSIDDFDELIQHYVFTEEERQKMFEYILYQRPELFREYKRCFEYSEEYLIELLKRDIRNYPLMKEYDKTGKLKMTYELMNIGG